MTSTAQGNIKHGDKQTNQKAEDPSINVHAYRQVAERLKSVKRPNEYLPQAIKTQKPETE